MSALAFGRRAYNLPGKFARQSLRTSSCVEESPGPAEQDAG
jgi:hypothetical protein